MPSKSTTITRIARIPYLNSAPFFHALSLGERYELTDCVPRELGRRAAAGEVTAGLLPLVDYFRLHETFGRVGPFGIAIRGRVHSVILFARKPIRQLEGATIAVTEETSTTAVLLRLLLEHRYGITPAAYVRVQHADAARHEPREDQAEDALLLIGDEALRLKQANTRYPFEIDLAFEWWLWQHLPFVFAVWAIRNEVSPQEKKELERGLSQSLAISQKQRDAIVQGYAERLNVPAPDLHRYLSNFIYRLSQPEEEGITRFKALIDEHHLL